jgi:hypothetical protein
MHFAMVQGAAVPVRGSLATEQCSGRDRTMLWRADVPKPTFREAYVRPCQKRYVDARSRQRPNMIKPHHVK